MCKMIIGISWIRYCIFAVGKFCLFKNNNKKDITMRKHFCLFLLASIFYSYATLAQNASAKIRWFMPMYPICQ